MNEQPEVIATKRTSVVLFGAYVEFMKMMLGNLFIMCAGSATALLTFAGAKGTSSPDLISEAGLKTSVILFGVGAFFAVVATGLMGWQENTNSSLVENAAPDAGQVLGRHNFQSYRWGLLGLAFMFLAGLSFSVGCYYGVVLK
ncbi:hypothetical protein [Mesorhizobium sp. STM 4661]|uniref:hypothetical protein n=1 Tax=Mesorhizobium sp. STM 4661 TaxID=1297570 RepID=UPI0002C03AB3|nr:hypothetical protein [Mesorhizobium sp. STM 4661]CCV15599.1 membrane hypothetical protein [Mesorhizobium sp. STM 4661]